MPAYASSALKTAQGEIGYHEKASNNQLESKTANSGSNNWNKYADFIDSNFPTFYNGRKNGYDWCDIFVDYVMLKTFGLNKALELLCQPLYSAGAGCIYSFAYYKAKGRTGFTPKVGAQVFFGSNENNLYHTGIVESFDNNYVYTIEGNSNEQVARRTYSRYGSTIYGYGYPNYDTETTTSSSTATVITKPIYSGPSNEVKWIGYICKPATPRTWAGAENPVLKSYKSLKVGTKIEVCDTVRDSKGSYWYYAKINGTSTYGFVWHGNVSKTDPTKKTTTSSTTTVSNNKKVKWYGRVIADVLNVRTGAGTTFKNLTSIPKIYYGTTIGVIDSYKASNGDIWYYIVINNNTYGYVHSAYITKII